MATKSDAATVLTVLNLKGGVGKTHTTWLIASVCQERGRRVLLVDCDPQANLTNSFLSSAGQHSGVEVLFDPSTEPEPHGFLCRTSYEHIDLLPASPQLARFDLADQRDWERADLQFSLVDAVEQLRPSYDCIVFDCPPRLSLVSFAALCASDGVVIPMEAADWGAQGIKQVTQAIRHVQKHSNGGLQLLGYLVSRFKRARAYQQTYLARLRAHFGELAFDTVIPDLARFEKSVTDRIPITVHSPSSEEADLAREFVDELDRRAQATGRRGRRRSHVRHGAAAGAGR